jgi:hypothetical protein
MPILMNKKGDGLFHLILTEKDLEEYKKYEETVFMAENTKLFGKNLLEITFNKDAQNKKFNNIIFKICG